MSVLSFRDFLIIPRTIFIILPGTETDSKILTAYASVTVYLLFIKSFVDTNTEVHHKFKLKNNFGHLYAKNIELQRDVGEIVKLSLQTLINGLSRFG